MLDVFAARPNLTLNTVARATLAQPSEPPDSPPVCMVALGDSLTHGSQDGNTVEERQVHGYAKLIANQAGIPFNLPLLDREGIPFTIFHGPTFDYQHLKQHLLKLGLAVAPLGLFTYFVGAPPVVAPVWDAVPGMGRRTEESRNTPQRPQHNFAVFGYRLRHLNTVHNTHDYLKDIHEGLSGVADVGVEVPLVRATLGNGQNDGEGSAVEQAVRQKPDLVIAWAGNNDALAAVSSGRLDDAVLTPVEDRPWTYSVTNPITGESHERTTARAMPGFRSDVLGDNGFVTRLLKESSAEIMLINIPDVTVVPLAKEVGKPVGKLPFRVYLESGHDVTADIENFVIPDKVRGSGIGGRERFPSGTRVSLAVVLKRIIEAGTPSKVEELRERLQAGDTLFTEDDVLDPQELATVNRRIQEFNGVLEEAARSNPRVHLVDAHGMLDDLVKNGRPLRGSGPDESVIASYTGTPDARGRDGIFSYDGVHPSDTGYAVIANLVLDKIRQDLGGQERFKRFRDAAAVDEKAAHRADPHAEPGREVGVVLEETHVDHLIQTCRI